MIVEPMNATQRRYIKAVSRLYKAARSLAPRETIERLAEKVEEASAWYGIGTKAILRADAKWNKLRDSLGV